MRYYFINDKGKSASLDAALSKSQNGDAFLKEDFNHFLKNNVDMSGLIFDGKAHPSFDAIELYFKAGVNPLARNMKENRLFHLADDLHSKA